MSTEATIRRGVRNASYSVVPNHVFEDVRLSMEARWLLGYLLSKPDNWTVVIGDIIKKGGCGRDKARKMIAELVEFGYAEREQVRDDGKFGASVLVIYDEPREQEAPKTAGITGANAESVAILPQTDLPATAKPAPDSPSPVKSAHSNNSNIPNTDSQGASAEEEGLKKVDRKKISRDFTLWYATWKKGDEEYGRNAWFALSDEERTECIERTPAYLRWAKPSDLMAAAVYLKNRHWRDMPESALADQSHSRGIAKVCGKLWMGVWLETVNRQPDVAPRFTLVDEQDIDDGKVTREQLARQKRIAYGWSLIVRMVDKAHKSEPFVTSLELLPQVEGFRQVERGSDIYLAWRRLHARRGLPFPDDLRDWLWLPPVDGVPDLDAAVEAALSQFLKSINEGRNDDAA
ncbi:helix-turn-helix domain-containing protein [Agrobacterium tumefaciens]|uniref:helix-turn-helix domain-containing protein n=1 Tax=Agrobacterium tumefaciens TaxID=358 RepID=UPI001574B620|nr:helix-turn-helix domain-containing protein [Agrobacterium tumefaciens]NTD84278.1 helix-turn-helix domain-containing protein [Agrobacterium tumefaciens]NTD94594.1 helix-turn-helix domain-containing protein [Agrobacterium tumefaciens]NTD96046.1 helix-turn-helix domain-containing protein [Agrobacterium tumefaciens]NTE13904.1 helix-turn-helix domain-containing protein [Agrobacterium tumefaciens]NTE19519.1 helix-turn-helix domain-containing protein [Agrobacterium tumefaciens]